MATDNQTYLQLLETLEGIRDERRMYANTATRIGNALIQLAAFVLNNGEFLSKVNDDTAAGLITFLKGLQSDGFAPGVKGFGIYKGDNGAWNLDIDNIDVRGKLGVNMLQVNQTKYLGGEVIITVGGSIEATDVLELEDGGWMVTFDTTDKNDRQVRCLMQPGDLAKCQTWNEASGQHFYWLEVAEVGDGYIKLQQLDGDTTEYDVPRTGDEIVHLGNIDDPERQAALIFSARSQSMRIYTGIHTTSLDGCEVPIDLNPVKSHILAEYIKLASGDSLDATVDSLKSKAEKEFVIWFGDYVPTLDNRPYTDWVTEDADERDLHLKDLFYIRRDSEVAQAGMAFRFEKDKKGNYSWKEDTDKDTLLALERAAAAQAAADAAKSSLEITNQKIEALVEGGYLNEDGTLKQSVSGLVLQKNWTAMFTDQTDENGQVVRAQISTLIEDGISKATIKANQITLDGHTVINDYFQVAENGDLTIGAKDAQRKLTVYGNGEFTGVVNATSGTMDNVTIGTGDTKLKLASHDGAGWISAGNSRIALEINGFGLYSDAQHVTSSEINYYNADKDNRFLSRSAYISNSQFGLTQTNPSLLNGGIWFRADIKTNILNFILQGLPAKREDAGIYGVYLSGDTLKLRLN